MAHQYQGVAQERELYVCYELHDCYWNEMVIFVPHFVRPEWVGPDYVHNHLLYTSKQLEARGAVQRVYALWPRVSHKPITHHETTRGLANGK